MVSDHTARVHTPGSIIDRPLRDEGFAELCVIRHGISRAGQDDTEDGDGLQDGGIVQVEYRVYASGMEGMIDGLNGVGEVDKSGGMQLLRLVSLAVLLVGLFLAAQTDHFSYWKQLVLSNLRPRNLLYALLVTIIIPKLFQRTIYESITALPGLGIQFTTQKAYILPHFIHPSSRETTFIPLSSVRPRTGDGKDAVFVHEGLQRWGVRYYLGVMWDSGGAGRGTMAAGDGREQGSEDTWKVQVGFPNLQPRLPILREVYHGVREVMFDDYESPPKIPP